ncbi:iron-containing redox enzyme family protein [Janthinobacterium agaricidamnosum]|uniref:Iron-containing redox enzyme family protein n=1 Tax=Janthinobacterium agaricidamnosum NBRC 102515 = DSM 9628 TaxID=1349767 RepID=W0VDE6_9BURK|nr:iron-containing redox enzyme family protein [Janthinobacterium agaricidamnosum]CDG85685.1 putative uncharacterized protein [Janthinobacterium agaricidamnosum NBRC 102515 = DSM 9628]
MLKLSSITSDSPALQAYQWPPVPAFTALQPDLRAFLELDLLGQTACINHVERRSSERGELLNNYLGTIYSYHYGYADSPCFLRNDIELESRLARAKLVLEEDLVNHWLPVTPIPQFDDQQAAANYLREYVDANAALHHPLFDYLRDEAEPAALMEFLRLETCRNEIVDDEIALLLCGLQGNMKKAIASNLWDECGNGSLEKFHTYWLRRLVEQLQDWEQLPQYRASSKPWFSSIISNTFNALVTRPAYKCRAYGMFLTTEARVAPHFSAIMGGLRRTGLDHRDIAVYFDTHMRIDPHHTDELLTAFSHQEPALNPVQVAEVVRGAHFAVAAGMAQYGRVLAYFQDKYPA